MILVSRSTNLCGMLQTSLDEKKMWASNYPTPPKKKLVDCFLSCTLSKQTMMDLEMQAIHKTTKTLVTTANYLDLPENNHTKKVGQNILIYLGGMQLLKNPKHNLATNCDLMIWRQRCKGLKIMSNILLGHDSLLQSSNSWTVDPQREWTFLMHIVNYFWPVALSKIITQQKIVWKHMLITDNSDPCK